MKIKFINPNSLKFGKEEHVKNLVGECLMAQGEAEEVKYSSYVERLRDDPNNKPPVSPDVYEWGTFVRSSGTVQIFRRQVASSETTYFKQPPLDCPVDVVKRFLAMTEPGTSQETYEAWKERVEREQHEQARKERLDLCKMGLSRLLYGDGK